MQPRTTALMTLALLACPACAVEDDYEDDDGDYESREVLVSGGTVFNTNHLEDHFSEVTQPTSGLHLYLTLNQLILPGNVKIEHFDLDNGEIIALDENGGEHRGAQLVGSEWLLNGWPNLQEDLRLTNFTNVDGLPHYSFVHAVDFDWVSNCPVETIDGTATPGLARMLNGFTLDQESGVITAASDMTFIACTTGAVGKAAKWGYYDLAHKLLDSEVILPGGPIDTLEPIEPSKAGMEVEFEVLEASEISGPKPPIEALEPFDPFELAIRVVRADYCYNGDSWTVPGVALMVEDVWNVRGPDPGRKIEAVWGANGLICAGTGRYLPKIKCPDRVIPTCAPEATLADYPDGLIMTRIPLGPADHDLT